MTPAPSASPKESATDRTGLLLAAGSAALFSLKAIVVKLGLQAGVTVETLLTWRMLLALPVYLVVGFVSFRAAAQRPATRSLAAAAGLGVLSYYVCSWLDFTGMRYISAQLERMILFTYPALTALLAWPMLGERPTRRHLASLGLAYAGVLLVFASESGDAGPRAGLGVALVFAAALLFAVYVVLSRPTITALGSRRFTCVAMTAATAAILTHQLVAGRFLRRRGGAALHPDGHRVRHGGRDVLHRVPELHAQRSDRRIGAGRTTRRATSARW